MSVEPSVASLLCTRSACTRSACVRGSHVKAEWDEPPAATAGSNASTAVPPAADSAGDCEGACGGMEKACVQAEGSSTSEQWVFVGPGRGRYASTPVYSFVGKGHGGFEQSQPTTHRQWRFTNCCITGTGILLVSVMLYFLLQSLKSGTIGSQFYFGNPRASLPTLAPVPTSTLAVEPYDCNERGLWSLAQRTWCCDNYDRGCTTPAPPQPTQPPPRIVVLPVFTPASAANAPSASTTHAASEVLAGSSISSVAAATASGAAGAVVTDCSEGRHDLLSRHQGCNLATEQQAQTTTTLPLFNCHAGAASWRVGWSLQKKAWCCRAMDVACLTPQAKVQLATTTENLPDCTVAFFNWQAAWSKAKKDYCCRHEARGCMDQPKKPL